MLSMWQVATFMLQAIVAVAFPFHCCLSRRMHRRRPPIQPNAVHATNYAYIHTYMWYVLQPHSTTWMQCLCHYIHIHTHTITSVSVALWRRLGAALFCGSHVALLNLHNGNIRNRCRSRCCRSTKNNKTNNINGCWQIHSDVGWQRISRQLRLRRCTH